MKASFSSRWNFEPVDECAGPLLVAVLSPLPPLSGPDAPPSLPPLFLPSPASTRRIRASHSPFTRDKFEPSTSRNICPDRRQPSECPQILEILHLQIPSPEPQTLHTPCIADKRHPPRRRLLYRLVWPLQTHCPPAREGKSFLYPLPSTLYPLPSVLNYRLPAREGTVKALSTLYPLTFTLYHVP
jgi:hypothetical protein